ncbi:MAG: UDP-N-acetylmuramoyl-L-alanyl-D-glutamate--2,6-diaminopimelate ligase [Pseudomonadota bacterium]
MRLSALIDDEADLPAGNADPEIRGLTADSRRVAPGDLFAALAGAKADGARFAGEAVAKGAAAVLVDAGAAVANLGVPVVRAREPRRALALMAARFSGIQPATALAVTGTSGKTSVAEFTRQILAALGRRAASLGTIGVVKPDGAVYGSLTTPDPIALHATLAELAREGVTHLAFEASSHGLDQHRLDGVRLTAAAFTNLGRDHMDYHPTVEHYLAAKLRLFRELLQPGQPAVINADGAMSSAALEAAKSRGLALLTVGRAGETLRLEEAQRDGFAQRLTICHDTKSYDIRLPLIGAYQVENALVAAGLAIAAGEDPERAISALEGLTGVSGRLEIVGEVRGGLVVVDYAHKPEALIAALAACRPFATGKLVCVFGCGGDRDKGKRPIMGRIAAEAADRVVVTDDNPRSERPEAIRAEILSGVPAAARAKVHEIGDRRLAIHAAVASIGPGDVVLIAGKGHETGQIVGDTVLPFSDHEVAGSEIRREMGHV